MYGKHLKEYLAYGKYTIIAIIIASPMFPQCCDLSCYTSVQPWVSEQFLHALRAKTAMKIPAY